MAHPATEIREGKWTACKDGPWYPELAGGGYVAYRIWKMFDGLTWFQRHEWKMANGDTEKEDWIITTAKGW